MPIAVRFIFRPSDFPELDDIEESEIEQACNELERSGVEEEIRNIVLNAVCEIREEEG